ncbi:MAG TPA: hypothetical protein VG245_10575 [Candidatus Dormibacteraeota bacterium]|jgi:hypothetical protein|nr:hypothetical protein [Candidatus Dormibacteraeota bacterium]
MQFRCRRAIGRVLAVVAAASTLGVGITAHAASASSGVCSPLRNAQCIKAALNGDEPCDLQPC